MTVAIHGVGAVGARAARFLVDAGVEVVLGGSSDATTGMIQRALGAKATVGGGTTAEVLVLAGPAGTHVEPARAALARGQSVVSTSDAVADIEALLDLDREARERGRALVIGAALSPGLSCVLAAHGGATFDQVEEVHIARSGAGGPACAAQHHRALGGTALDWRDRGWQERRAGSGRELCWFPDPIGPRDCYRAGLGDALLLVRAFPGVQRVTARLAANRRDRVTSRLPTLRSAAGEGGPGAIRVELRGRRGTATAVAVYGALERPASAAGAVAGLVASQIHDGTITHSGAGGLAEMVETVPFLRALADRGVRAAAFEGTA